MNANDMKPGALFTTNGQDVWKMEFCYQVPSCTLKNLETGDTMNFGMGGLTAQNFVPLVPARELPQSRSDAK